MRKSRIPPPAVFNWTVSDYPPVPIIQLPMEERYRNVPTRSIEEYLLMGVLVPEARAAALAELARRGVEPPKSEGGNP
jgi:hypothetical protein